MDDDNNTQDDSMHASVVPETKQPRLNVAGRALLKDFLQTVSSAPTVAQKEELLVKILALGNEHYNIGKVSNWFVKARYRRHKGNQFNLTDQAVETLKFLLHVNPDPTEDTMRAWAGILDAQVESVRSWVARSQEAPENPIGPPCNSLPPPPPTVSQTPALRDSTNAPEPTNYLELWFRETPYPTDDNLKLWASNLGLTFEVVREWVHAQSTPPDSRDLFFDYSQGYTQDHLPSSPNKNSHTQTDVLAMNGPFPLPPALVLPKAVPAWRIVKLPVKPADQNRRLLFDIAERMDLDDPPTTHVLSTSLSEPGPCGHPPSELQPQESSSKTMTREQFQSSFGPIEIKMRRVMDQVGQGALEAEGWDKAFVPERFQVTASAL
ncbi:hypothetical protein BDZ89DRAFT_1169383 [Hymenopellis radicata]|nr:hypothetical protein BDZ89DRAFT_1169383 [Hymenopellis radicata]